MVGAWMDARSGARYSYCYNKIELGSKIVLGPGWLRAVAQGESYSYSKIHLGINFQTNSRSWIIKLGWGLDGCARWRKVTVTIAVKLNWGVNFKKI